jgi:replicative DNA helicase
MNDFIQRIPPYSKEAEQAVLGAVLLDNSAINHVSDILTPEHFYFESHACIYEAMLKLSEERWPIDLVTMQDALKKSGRLEASGGLNYLGELSGLTPITTGIAHYAAIVREKAMLRRMIKTGQDIVAEGYEQPEDVEEFIDRAENAVFSVGEDRLGKPYYQVSELLSGAIRSIEDMEAGRCAAGLPSGFYDLDSIISGFRSGEMIVVAARPGMGKTSLALNFASNAAIKSGKSVAVFSMEMARNEITLRLLCSLARVNSRKFRSGKLTDDEWIRLTAVAADLEKAQIFIDDSAGLSPMELLGKARRIKRRFGLDMIIVDYIQLMQAKNRRRDGNREQEIAYISASMKLISKELELPVIALSQLNRELEKRTDKRPQLSDLRESGAIEQDADMVLFIYRDAFYHPETVAENKDAANQAEIIVAKHRAGPTGKAEVNYFAEFTLFENQADENDYPQQGVLI